MPDPRASFTLIEFLIVIGIVAVLSVVVLLLLTLNPVQFLKQARDASRLSDMDTLNRAVTLYLGEGGSLGNTSTTYFSIIDPAATTTAGTDCSGVGGLTPPPNWTYHCAASSTQRQMDGTGWLPMDFKSLSYRSPFGSLPVDPTNSTSSGYYYTYTPSATAYALAATIESDKYIPKAANDGGYDPGRYETGSNLALIALQQGLVGWWTFEEGSGATAKDYSGNGNNGVWAGTGGHYATGKVDSYAGQFDGTDDYVRVSNAPTINLTNGATLMGWINPASLASPPSIIGKYASDPPSGSGSYLIQIPTSGGALQLVIASSTGSAIIDTATGAISTNAWYFIAGTYDGTSLTLFVNGLRQSTTLTGSASGNILATSLDLIFGARHTTDGASIQQFFTGKLDDLRVYSRPLSAPEIAAIYNATK